MIILMFVMRVTCFIIYSCEFYIHLIKWTIDEIKRIPDIGIDEEPLIETLQTIEEKYSELFIEKVDTVDFELPAIKTN